MCDITNAECYIQLNAMAELIYKYVVETLLYFWVPYFIIDTLKVISYNDETNKVLNNNKTVIVRDVRC